MDRQSTPPRRTLSTIGALVLLIGVLALHLDRSPFTPGEATTAAIALAPVDHESRVPAGNASHALIRGFGVAVTTTERGLRLLILLGILLGAVVVGEVAAHRGTAEARPIVYVTFAALPCFVRQDLLYPGLLAPLPLALVLGGAPFVRGQSWWWLVGAVAGAAACTTLDARILVTAIGILGAVAMTSGASATRRALLVGTAGVAAGAAWWAAGFPFVLSEALAGEPGVLTVVGIGGPGIVTGLVVLALLFACATERNADGVVRLCIAVLLATVVICVPLLAGSGFSDTASSCAILVPAIAAAAAALSRKGRIALAFVALAAACVIAAAVPRALSRVDAAEPSDESLHSVLDRARQHGATGGRLVLWSESRHALLYYARRGHDPAMPLILVDEDASLDSLADLLRVQLRAERGREHTLPPILIHPRPHKAPPGLMFVDAEWADDSLALVQLTGG